LKDLDVDSKIILKFILKEIGLDGMDWIDLAWDRKTRRAVVKAVCKLRVP
jgi:hypothetical protein